MSRQIQIRRGTAFENDNFTGAIGEVTMDITNKTLRVHDGETVGGTVLAKQSEIPDLTNADYVVESQFPTAENNYTWYRKYKSGWVEIGGLVSTNSSDSNIITLPITMADTNYHIIAMNEPTDSINAWGWVFTKRNSKTTTGFMLSSRYGSGQEVSLRARWQVSGLCA